MSTTLKEWLKHTIAELEEERDAVPGAVNEDAALALSAMKRALASLEAEPVSWTDEQELRDVAKFGCAYQFTVNPITPNADPRRVIKLYTAPPAPLVPDGWVMVPVEPTEHMIVQGFESEPDEGFGNSDAWEAYDAMSGCQQAAHRAKLCWAAMIAAAPKPLPSTSSEE